MRIITVEEHLQHPRSARVAPLSGPPPMVPVEALTHSTRMPPRLGGDRLAHRDKVGIDVQVVSHGKGSPSTLQHPEFLWLWSAHISGTDCRAVKWAATVDAGRAWS
jgi:hypothetical protein